MSVFTDCGGYFPGYEPRIPTPTSNTIPPVYIPNQNNEVTIFNVETSRPDPGKPLEVPRPGEGQPRPPTPGSPPGPAGPVPPVPPRGPGQTGGPAGPSAPVPGFRPRDTVRPPTTGGPAGPSAPVPGIPRPARRRPPTTGGPAGPSAPIPTGLPGGGVGTGGGGGIGTGTPFPFPRPGGGEPTGGGSGGGGTSTGGTPNTTAPTFKPSLLTTEPTPGSVVINNSIKGEVLPPSNQYTPTTAGVNNSSQVFNSIKNSIPERQTISVEVQNPKFIGFASSSTSQYGGIFNKVYNFFNFPSKQESNFVDLGSFNTYGNIFSNIVAEEVRYFLNNQKSNIAWNETVINNLSLQKIGASLRPELLTAFNGIHGAGNIQIGSNKFLSLIKKHLIEGTLNEFDPQVYLDIYQKQLQDPFIIFNETGQNPNTINLAFAIFEQKGINPDYNKGSPIELTNDFIRMRFLPEDLESYIPIVEIDGTNSELYVKNSGIPTEQIAVGLLPNPASGITIPFGNGAGYYFSAMVAGTSAIYPLPTQNLLSSAYYLEGNDRYNVLTLLGADPSFRFTCKSQSGVHEFSSTYNPSADVNVMYFALSADSVRDVLKTNSVITTTSASYYLMTDAEAIEHSRSNGFNVIKVNTDFRDPILNYALATSSLAFECDEFNLKSLGRNTSISSDKVILHNIPQAVILTPGCGSYHNPFSGKSSIIMYEDDVVTRTLSVQPSIDNSTSFPNKPVLEQKRIYLETTSSFIGPYEEQFKKDDNGFIYQYNPNSISFEKSYYINGQYSNIQPDSSFRTNSPEAKFMNLVDRLTSVAKTVKEDFTQSGLPDMFGFVTWYDIFRRLKLSEVGELKFSNVRMFQDKLKDGYSNGIPVKAILNETNAFVTGIPEFYEDQIYPPATKYINDQDRLEAFAKYNPLDPINEVGI